MLGVTTSAHAHPGHEHTGGFLSGLVHAFTTAGHGLMWSGVILLVALIIGYFGMAVRRPDSAQSKRLRSRDQR